MNLHVTVTKLQAYKRDKRKIAALTAYDCPMAALLDEQGIDMVLVGDSLAQTVLGYKDTIQVTMEDMIHHTKAVSRGIQNALVIGDMPFMSYQASPTDAIKNAGRFLQEGGAHGVKIEGGKDRIRTIAAVLDAGIPVLGHLGLTPQSLYQMGGYKVQGKTSDKAQKILEDALALEQAGVFAVVLELVPYAIAKVISGQLTIPTIGIGSGPYCDGQILVVNDILGMTSGKPKKHSKQYANLKPILDKAVQEYILDVQKGQFPSLDNAFEIDEEELKEFIDSIKKES